MTLIIGSTNVSDYIRPPTISETARSQSINYTLNGTAAIDRISQFLKYSISVTFPGISQTVWEELKAELRAISFNVTFTNGASNVTKVFYLEGELPTPVLYADNGGYICSEIQLTLREV